MKRSNAVLMLPLLALLGLTGCPGSNSPTTPNPPAPTNTPVPSATPTSTATVTPSSTPSGTPTTTASFTPSGTPTLTGTSTPTGTPTLTTTETASATPTSTPSPTVTVTFTPTAYFYKHYTLGTYGISGGPGTFTNNQAVAVSIHSGAPILYVSDVGNNRVQFTQNSSVWITFGGTGAGSAQGQFSTPGGLAIDGSRNVYVSDTGNGRIQFYDFVGATWSTISTGSGAGHFFLPNGMQMDGSGNIWVYDETLKNVQEYVPGVGWSIVATSYPGSQGQGLGVNSAGTTIYIADYADSKVYMYSSGSWGTFVGGTFGTGHGQFESASDAKVDSQGNVFVSDAYANQVQEFDSSGNFLTVLGNGDLLTPQGLAIDSQENVYVGDSQNGRIVIYSYVP